MCLSGFSQADIFIGIEMSMHKNKKMQSKLSEKALTAILVLSLVTGALTACSSPSGDGKVRKPSESTADSKQEYDPSDETVAGTVSVETVTATSGGADDQDDYVFNKDDWYVNEYEDHGLKYTQIGNSGRHGRNGEIDYVLYKIYANEEDAKKGYQAYYDKSRDFDKGHWEEGGNWFISDEWGVTDATIVWMVYREGNVLIIVNLALNNHWIVYGDDQSSDGTEPSESSFKGFVLNNVSYIISFVKENFPEAF